MITPSFSLTATERVLPKLALDFTTASLDSRVTFTRTTDATNPATYINSSGVIVSATNNQPRFDHDPVTKACKGLLIEESRQNTLAYSAELNNAYFEKVSSSISADAATAPDGSATADKLIMANGWTTASPAAGFRRNSGTSIGAGVLSIYAKAAEHNTLAFRNNSSGARPRVNLTTGQIISGSDNLTINNAGDGWWRVTVSGASVSANLWWIQTDQSGDGTSGIYVWGAQLEAGAFATSYIPTTTTALTRNADVATMTGTNFSDWFNPSEGTFTSRYTPSMTSAAANIIRGPVIVDGGSFNESINIGVLSGQNGMRVYDGGTELVNMLRGTISANVNYQIAGAYKLNDYAVAVNGGAVTTDTSATVPTPDRLAIGRYVTGGTFFSGLIQNIMYWPMRLTNAEVQAFSKQG